MDDFKTRLSRAESAAQARHIAAKEHLTQQVILKKVLLTANAGLEAIGAMDETATLEMAKDSAHKTLALMSGLLEKGLGAENGNDESSLVTSDN